MEDQPSDDPYVPEELQARKARRPSERTKVLVSQSLVSKIGYLRLNDLTGSSTNEADQILSNKGPGRVFGPGDAVFSNGQSEPYLMLVRQGAVNIFRSFRGEKLFIKKLDGGAIFGEMRMFGQSMHGAQAEAAEWSELVSLTIRDIEALARACPGFMLRLATELGPRLAEAQRRYEMAVFQQVPERLASVLLDLASSDGEINDVSQQELADRVGVYRETISLAIAELKRMGLILAARRKIRLIDVEGLRSFISYGHT